MSALKEIITNPLVLFSIVTFVLSAYFLNASFILFGILYFLVIVLAINFIAPRLGGFLVNIGASEVKGKGKMNVEIIELPERFEKHFKRSSGFVFLFQLLISFNFLALLLIIKYFGLVGSSIREIITSFILAMVIAAISSFIITPIAVSIYILEGSRFREFNPKNMVMDYPAYFYRRIIKSIFGYGNLVVLLWLLVDLLQVTNFDIVSTLKAYFLILLLAFSSVSFGALIALAFERRAGGKAETELLNTFNEKLKEVSKHYTDWLEELNKTLIEPKPVKQETETKENAIISGNENIGGEKNDTEEKKEKLEKREEKEEEN